MKIRPYTPEDRDSCLVLLTSNTPEFFSVADRSEFEQFLDELPGVYFVGEQGDAVVACGGWAKDSSEIAALTWGIVHRDHHGQGLGKALMTYRLKDMSGAEGLQYARLRTIPSVMGFFEQFGFQTVAVNKDGYGPGWDMVTMQRPLG